MAGGYDEVLWELARQQAAQFNSSPVSQAVNKDLSEAGQAIVDALASPGNALRGDYNYAEVGPGGSVAPFNAGLIGAAANTSGILSLGAMPMPRPANSLGMAGRGSLDKLLAEARQRLAARDDAVNQLASSGKQSVRMSGKAGSALVGPDMSKQGGFRVTYFDPAGVPNGHVETTSYADALRRALMDGFSPRQ